METSAVLFCVDLSIPNLMTMQMLLLFSINFQSGEFYYENTNSGNCIAVIISLFAVFIAYSGVRFQVLALLQNQLADKAKDCNKNIHLDSQRIIETPQNISHVVSTIITGESLIEQVLKNKILFTFGGPKQSLVDQFYLQLHTSIIEYIIANIITPAFEEGQVKEHVSYQLDYCKTMFVKSIETYGNATPKSVREKLDRYKEKIRQENS